MTAFEDYQDLTDTNSSGEPGYVFSNPVLLNNNLPLGVPVVFLVCPAANSDIVPQRIIAIVPGDRPAPAVLSMVELWGELHFSPAVESIGGLSAEGTYVFSANPNHPGIPGFGTMRVSVGSTAAITSDDVPPLETADRESIVAEIGLGETGDETAAEPGDAANFVMAYETYGSINFDYPVGWSIAEVDSDEE